MSPTVVSASDGRVIAVTRDDLRRLNDLPPVTLHVWGTRAEMELAITPMHHQHVVIGQAYTGRPIGMVFLHQPLTDGGREWWQERIATFMAPGSKTPYSYDKPKFPFRGRGGPFYFFEPVNAVGLQWVRDNVGNRARDFHVPVIQFWNGRHLARDLDFQLRNAR